MNEDRVATGIEEFDNLIEGGIPKGYLVLLAGNPGSGKTIFAAQYLYNGLRIREPGIYVSFGEDKKVFMKNMKRMGMNFEKYEKKGVFKHLDFITVRQKGIEGVLERIFTVINSIKAKRLVIDSISALNQAFPKMIDARIVLHTIVGKITRTLGVTTILISEIPLGSGSLGGGTEEFVSDGVIVLSQYLKAGFLNRKLHVIKMRGTKIDGKQRRYSIEEN